MGQAPESTTPTCLTRLTSTYQPSRSACQHARRGSGARLTSTACMMWPCHRSVPMVCPSLKLSHCSHGKPARIAEVGRIEAVAKYRPVAERTGGPPRRPGSTTLDLKLPALYVIRWCNVSQESEGVRAGGSPSAESTLSDVARSRQGDDGSPRALSIQKPMTASCYSVRAFKPLA
jgi:hypothetical protein